MKKTLFFLTVFSVLVASCGENKSTGEDSKDFVEHAFQVADQHFTNAIAQNQDLTKFPRSTNPDGSLNTRAASNWVSGFFPGNLWYMYEYTNDPKYKDAATNWTEALSEQQYNTGTHDVGFIINCSYGNGNRLTSNDNYGQVMVQASKSLSTRFNENVGCIKSWDWSKEWEYPVIVDNMMNLELLFEAANISGEESFKDIAIAHANTTMKNHFREDNSSYHVVDYNPESGDVVAKVTHQGFSDESAWSRGQAWGIYGYTVCYRETKNDAYLDQAKKIADYIMNHPNTPDDLIPYWDYNAPNIPNEPRDASAAAIIAGALLELSTYQNDQSQKYFDYAEQILQNLSSDQYLAEPGTNNNFLLKHCTGHKPADSEVDVPLVYGDYYYLEALLRYKRLRG